MSGLQCALLLTGCAIEPAAPSPQEPIGVQLLRARPELRQQRFAVKLDFEAPSERVFVAAEPAPPKIDSRRAHTGGASLALPPGTRRVIVNLPLLTADTLIQSHWTLLGVFLHAKQPLRATIGYEAAGQIPHQRPLTLDKDRWTAAMLDLTDLPSDDGGLPIGNLTITFARPLPATVWLDDVVLIDNRQTLVGGAKNGAEKGSGTVVPSTLRAGPETVPDPFAATWTIRRRGFHIDVEQPGQFKFTLDTIDGADDGWTIHEANAFRARFVSGDGQRTLVVYSDGRAYADGRYQPLGHQADLSSVFVAQHAGPANIDIPDEFGRLDRATPGDANNDAYNEALGAYQLIASGPRFEFTITPNAPLHKPIIEIANLPPGQLLVTIEGRLVERHLRTDDGRALIELPGRIERPTTVHLRVHDPAPAPGEEAMPRRWPGE